MSEYAYKMEKLMIEGSTRRMGECKSVECVTSDDWWMKNCRCDENEMKKKKEKIDLEDTF